MPVSSTVRCSSAKPCRSPSSSAARTSRLSSVSTTVPQVRQIRNCTACRCSGCSHATKDRVVSSRCASPTPTRNSRLRYVLAGVAARSAGFNRSSNSYADNGCLAAVSFASTARRCFVKRPPRCRQSASKSVPVTELLTGFPDAAAVKGFRIVLQPVSRPGMSLRHTPIAGQPSFTPGHLLRADCIRAPHRPRTRAEAGAGSDCAR